MMKTRCPRRSGRNRRGVANLVELLSIIASIGLITSLSSVLLVAVMRSQGTNSDLRREALSNARLARQFRLDAHEATSVEIDAQGEMVFTGESGETTYRWDDRRFHRTAKRDDVTHREQYAIAVQRRTKCNLELVIEGDVAQIIVTKFTGDQRRRVALSASVGLIHRLGSGELAQGETP
ncbi:MAG: hypothetical protein QGG36_08265 [Pirellulaceae bacterium]|jgi:hypothetical protein|nr:hypothetical protein [Pirellulaceae bacterium]MDP7015778.1 hypothetical protein [Pirellulaceae bacterium]